MPPWPPPKASWSSAGTSRWPDIARKYLTLAFFPLDPDWRPCCSASPPSGAPALGADEPGRPRHLLPQAAPQAQSRAGPTPRSPIRCASGSKASWPPSTAAPAAAILPRTIRIRRYQDSATKQQAELDRVTMQAKRMGCDSSGFLLAVQWPSRRNAARVNNQIQQEWRGNLDQIKQQP